MPEMNSVYLIVGFAVVANIGTIITVIFSALKLAHSFGELVAQVKQNSKDLNVSFEKIRELDARIDAVILSQMDGKDN